MTYIYCPYCGDINNEDTSFCDCCKRYVKMVHSKYDIDYYRQKSIEKYGDTKHAITILFDLEISNNPLYQEEEIEDENKRIQRIQKNFSYSQPPKPKCPTCGSTNIQKISDLRKAGGAIMFGLFSTTARSQFECKNCGMKF